MSSLVWTNSIPMNDVLPNIIFIMDIISYTIQIVANIMAKYLSRTHYYIRNAHDFIEENSSLLKYVRVCKGYYTEIMKKGLMYSPDKFRHERMDYELSWLIHDFAYDIMKVECYFGVLSILIVTDMIQLLIRVDYITQREMGFSTHRMKLVQRIIGTILSEEQLNMYKNCFDYCDPMLVNEWEQMNERMRERNLKPINSKMAALAKTQDGHAVLHHKQAEYSVWCNRNDMCCTQYLIAPGVRFYDTTSKEAILSLRREER